MRNIFKFKAVAASLLAFALAACSLLDKDGTTPNLPTPTQIAQAVSPTNMPQLTPATQLAVDTGTLSAPSPTSSIQPSLVPVIPSPSAPAVMYSEGQYAVIKIKEGDVLNVRQSPGTPNAVLETLPPHAAGLTLTGKMSQVGGENWVEIKRLTGGTGWVNAAYLTEYHPASSFCGDGQVTALLEAFKTAILNKNAEQLAALVSPLHGVTVQYLRSGKTATYTSDKALWLFTSTYQMDWGVQPGSGLELKGSFHEEVLPKLVDVLGSSYTLACNNPQTGGASYTYHWPFEYGNMNFYSLYRPGKAGDEQNWRTWLVGIEYTNNKPYLFLLVHLFWEP